MAQCELCGREVARRTRHHLIPRTRHQNRRNKREFTRSEVRERLAWLCSACHKQVHAVLDHKSLEREWNTIEKLRTHPELVRFIEWIRKRPDGHVRVYRRRGSRDS
jgi:5-methylcytosine-specific restriction endonuclease McrA